LQQGAVPGGTVRNFQSYGHKIAALTDEQKSYLCDPQTSGGLLVCVEPGADEAAAQALFAQHGLTLESFGELRPHTAGQPWIVVE
jgi:selenide,water dikinase